ncbi:DUF5683 domain-containing protein [Maribacter polysaccharolyticus]|uniref:DUF5683 domain-containing protein n=1 Tax=Maribacter polysaccharolyticus TaxID=3020831 RepID=UPI00237F9F6E|nr:DUF5683 domain-containing protein [Maribacter polysaccharolyticus]MDE3743597.1 DUF5683 domain-containing protein [Maribacter polysaccharolyticus]
MNKLLLTLLFIILSVLAVSAQENDSIPKTKAPDPSAKDSLEVEFKEKGIIVEDDVEVIKEKKVMNPLAPSKAAFYSAVLPGLGQIYNKRYWKVPIVYAALGVGVYAYKFNDDYYKRFRTAYKRRVAGFTDDEFYDINGDNAEGADPDLDLDDLEYQQEKYQEDRDLSLVITIAMYALNIIDANVDAHLKQFNVDDDLSLDIDVHPYLDLDPITSNPSYGVAFTIKF